MERWLDLTVAALRAVQPGLPELDRARCLPARHAGSGCIVCREVCPRAALGEGPVPCPEPGDCDGCSACVAACPTGALKSAPIADAIERWLDGIAATRQRGTGATVAAVSCAYATANQPRAGSSVCELSLPCLGAVRAADLVAAAAVGATEVVLSIADCGSCERGPAGSAGRRAAVVAQRTLGTVGVPVAVEWREMPAVACERHAGGRTAAPDPSFAQEAVSRRDLFGAWRGVARRAASEVVRETEAAPEMVARHGQAPRWRQRLEGDVSILGARSGSGGPLPLELGIGLPVVQGTCDGCGLCALVCPLTALTVADGSVACRPGACTACGLCAETCPTHGLAVWALDSRSVIPTASLPWPQSEHVGATSRTVLAARGESADRGIKEFARHPVARVRAAGE